MGRGRVCVRGLVLPVLLLICVSESKKIGVVAPTNVANVTI